LAATIPDCEIVVMPGIGHYPHLEAPGEYVALIKRFLARTLARPRSGGSQH
jgi:pimeloyl-ACP methyl ester carboxylesterase